MRGLIGVRRALSALALATLAPGVSACTVTRRVAPQALAPEREVRVTFAPARALEFETATGTRERRDVSRLEGVVRAARGDTAWISPRALWDERGKSIVRLTPPAAVAVLGQDTTSVIAARQVSAGRTVGLVAGVGAVAFLALVIVWAATFRD
jgi:hypothetical protein